MHSSIHVCMHAFVTLFVFSFRLNAPLQHIPAPHPMPRCAPHHRWCFGDGMRMQLGTSSFTFTFLPAGKGADYVVLRDRGAWSYRYIECASITRLCGFYDECNRRYNIKMRNYFATASTLSCSAVSLMIRSFACTSVSQPPGRHLSLCTTG